MGKHSTYKWQSKAGCVGPQQQSTIYIPKLHSTQRLFQFLSVVHRNAILSAQYTVLVCVREFVFKLMCVILICHSSFFSENKRYKYYKKLR